MIILQYIIFFVCLSDISYGKQTIFIIIILYYIILNIILYYIILYSDTPQAYIGRIAFLQCLENIASLVSAMFQPFPRYVLHTPHTTLLSNTLTSSDLPSTTLPSSRGLIIHALATRWARYMLLSATWHQMHPPRPASIQVFPPRNCGSNLQLVTKWINMHNKPHPTRQKACFAPSS